jgi:Uma2 family endonuclease
MPQRGTEIQFAVPRQNTHCSVMPPAKHRFTVSDYYRMGEAGIFPPDARVELLEGEIIDMMPIGPFHSGVVNRLNRFMNSISGGRWLVTAQNPVRLNRHSEPEPDVVLVRPAADDYTSRHPSPEDVLLLIEVAESSLDYDRREKLAAYGKAGIEEYWIVNLPEQCVEVYREPHFTGYASVTTLKPGDTASPRAFPDVQIDLAALLRKPGE